MIDSKILHSYADQIRSSNVSSLKPKLKHLFEYLDKTALENQTYIFYQKDSTKWKSWSPLELNYNSAWSIPDSHDDCKSLSMALYRAIANWTGKIHVIPLRLFKGPNINNILENFHDTFWPYLVEAINDIIQEESDLQMQGKQVNPECVFVIHGRNEKLRRALFEFLRSIGLKPIEWSQAVALTQKGSPYIGEILDVAFSSAQAIIVLFTPDDEAKLSDSLISTQDGEFEKSLTGQARANVLFEAGMAIGRNQDRTILIEVGKLRPFSDIYGRHIIKMDGSSQKRQDVADRLKTAGCKIDLTGRDWHDAGDFRL